MASMSAPDLTSTAPEPAASRPQGWSKGELNDFTKGVIVGMNICDASNRQIGQQVERNEATVWSFLKWYISVFLQLE